MLTSPVQGESRRFTWRGVSRVLLSLLLDASPAAVAVQHTAEATAAGLWIPFTVCVRIYG